MDTSNPVVNSSLHSSLLSSLLCIEAKSIGFGYRVVKTLGEVAGMRVIEASPAGDRFVVLAVGDAAAVATAEASARNSLDSSDSDQWLDHENVSECERSVLEALYNLPQVEAQESLLVVECLSISGLVGVAHALVHTHKLQVIELKIRRSGGGAYGFFTGPSARCAPAAEDARTKLRRSMREGRVELLEELNAEFRRYFNITGV